GCQRSCRGGSPASSCVTATGGDRFTAPTRSCRATRTGASSCSSTSTFPARPARASGPAIRRGGRGAPPSPRGRAGGSGEPAAAVDADRLAALAERALLLVRDDTAIGLGAGRAAEAFVRSLGQRVKGGLRVRGVPASEQTAALARKLGIPLTTLEEPLD